MLGFERLRRLALDYQLVPLRAREDGGVALMAARIGDAPPPPGDPTPPSTPVFTQMTSYEILRWVWWAR